MAKKTKYIFLLLLIPTLCFGGWFSGSRSDMGRFATDASCSTANITFWWRCEAADFSATNGTLDYSANDDTGSLSSSAAINTDAVKVGTNGLDIPTSADYISFDEASLTMDQEGRIGFWYRITDFTDGSSVINVKYSNDNEFELQHYGTDELAFIWKDGGTTRTALQTSAANIGTGTWYFIEITWKTSTNYREIFVNGNSEGSSSATIDNFAQDPTLMRIGNFRAIVADSHIDNFIISSDSTDDLYQCKDETEWPE